MNGNGTTTKGGEGQWILSEEEFGQLAALKKTTDLEEAQARYKATGLVQALGMRLKLYPSKHLLFNCCCMRM